MAEREYQQILELIRTVILPDYRLDQSLFDERKQPVNWKQLYEIAYKQDIAGYLYPGTESLSVPEDVSKIFQTAYHRSVRKEAIVHLEVTALMEEFDRQGIDYLPMKGWQMKKLYPSPELRTMTDVDILIRPEQFEAACRVIEGRGFELNGEIEHHNAYVKKPVTEVELHRKLFAVHSTPYPLFASVWDRALPVREHEYTMNPVDMYMYMIAHMAKHFVSNGAGIRNIIDICLYRRSLPFTAEQTDEINRALEPIELKTFSERISSFADVCFSAGPMDNDQLFLFHYIISGGLYGKAGNGDVMRLMKQESGNKFRWFIKELFPNRERLQLKMEMPEGSISKPLYPFYWIKWMIRGFLKRRENIKKRLVTVTKSKKETEPIKNMLEYLDLKEIYYS